MTMVTSWLTQSTCADMCWYARENVCKCSCGGANHGVLLEEGVEQPKRTKQSKGYRYELEAVFGGENARRDAEKYIEGA